MTVAAFYHAEARNGRAMLTADRWLVRLRFFGLTEFWHCDGRVDTVHRVEGDRDVGTLRDFCHCGGRPRKPPLSEISGHAEMSA